MTAFAGDPDCESWEICFEHPDAVDYFQAHNLAKGKYDTAMEAYVLSDPMNRRMNRKCNMLRTPHFRNLPDPIVRRIQGQDWSSDDTPADGDVPVWDGAQLRWEPGTAASGRWEVVVYDDGSGLEAVATEAGDDWLYVEV